MAKPYKIVAIRQAPRANRIPNEVIRLVFSLLSLFAMRKNRPDPRLTIRAIIRITIRDLSISVGSSRTYRVDRFQSGGAGING